MRRRRDRTRGHVDVPGIGTITRVGSWGRSGLRLTTVDGRTALATRQGWSQRPVFAGPTGLTWTASSRWRLQGTLSSRTGTSAVLRPERHGRLVLCSPDGTTLATFPGVGDVVTHPGADALQVLAVLVLQRWQHDDATTACLAATTLATSS